MTNSLNKQKQILDAAAELIIRHGYDKTTVSDIARKTGISKGAVYLHFQSKDQLFEALLLREMSKQADLWLRLVECDPQGGTMAGVYKNMLLALNEHPFMEAMLRQDTHIFGNYLRRPDNFFRRNKTRSTRHEFIELMQSAGTIRSDLDPKVTAHIMNMLSYGLVSMNQIVHESDIPPTRDIIEGIAVIMDRALTPEGGGNSEAGKAIIRRMVEAGRVRFEALRTADRGTKGKRK